ncbi:hypothetical protein BC828DRAFT_75697 [Blastocladiella britannica]|nr:hypothetical protein BC828DRAFT_75697 [Blastocladiella britannica]
MGRLNVIFLSGSVPANLDNLNLDFLCISFPYSGPCLALAGQDLTFRDFCRVLDNNQLQVFQIFISLAHRILMIRLAKFVAYFRSEGLAFALPERIDCQLVLMAARSTIARKRPPAPPPAPAHRRPPNRQRRLHLQRRSQPTPRSAAIFRPLVDRFQCFRSRLVSWYLCSWLSSLCSGAIYATPIRRVSSSCPDRCSRQTCRVDYVLAVGGGGAQQGCNCGDRQCHVCSSLHLYRCC